MCFFRKKKKQLESVRETKSVPYQTIDATKAEPVMPIKPAPEPEKTPEPVAKATPKPEPIPEPKIVSEAKTAPKKPTEKPTNNETRYQGKYEVFPEAGLYKYRLKASNGEILIVSQGYTTKSGALSGIDTLKKNVVSGKQEIYTDKSNFSQFRLMTSTGSRLVAAGEFYDSEKSAQSAYESVQKFAMTDRISELNQLPKEESREEVVSLKPVDENPNGKYEVVMENKQWFFLLKASNGEVLMESQGYSSKSGAYSGLENVKKALEAETFRVSRDKQDRYMFILYASNNQALITGHTYPSKENCLAAVDSVRRFGLKAKVVEL
ncbi:MAG: DUF1508 domain-containing protein [Candidatus Izemoplasmatales bacterium]|nr:DUF1508 domain-containing protein [Candidatus Izemoplasmatales bacterium]MDY0373317.1 DUF1508 domain-containing protein [Candidatus Izemoplasmatales bacterium]